MAADATYFIDGFLSMANIGPNKLSNRGILGLCFHEDQALTNIVDEAMKNLRAKEYQTAAD